MYYLTPDGGNIILLFGEMACRNRDFSFFTCIPGRAAENALPQAH